MAVRLTREEGLRLGILQKERGTKRLYRPEMDDGSPQSLLWHSISSRWPQAIWEFPGAVPGRRFLVDIAFPEERLAIEVDGWQFHGKYLSSFKKDRERQNLLTIHGWKILRFFPEQIFQERDEVLNVIAMALKQSDKYRR
jgi:very-short-patch-repair endonuclease